MILSTTLNTLASFRPDLISWKQTLKTFPGDFPRDEPFDLIRILEANGVQDFLWSLRATLCDSIPYARDLALLFAQNVMYAKAPASGDDLTDNDIINYLNATFSARTKLAASVYCANCAYSIVAMHGGCQAVSQRKIIKRLLS